MNGPTNKPPTKADDDMCDRHDGSKRKHEGVEEEKAEEAEGYPQVPPYYNAFPRNENTEKRGNNRYDTKEEQEEEVVEEEAEAVNSAVPPIVGDFAVNQQGEVRRGGDDGTLTSAMSELETLRSDPMPQPSRDDGTLLVEAAVVDEDENARLREENIRLRQSASLIALTEPAQVATVIDQERMRKRRRMIMLGIVLQVVAVVVGFVVFMSSINSGSSGNTVNEDNNITKTEQALGLATRLVGVNTTFVGPEIEMWTNATKDYVEAFYNSRRRHLRSLQTTAGVQDVATSLLITNTEVLWRLNGTVSLKVTYNQVITYTSSEKNDVPMETLVTEPFRTDASRLAYMNLLKVAGKAAGNDIFDNLVGTSPVSIIQESPPWQSLGQVLNGKASNDFFGDSVSLSRNGSVMAVGAGQTSSDPGYVSVLQFSQDTQEWTPLGQDLVGQANGDNFGESASLNGDGMILAVGANHYDPLAEGDAGYVQVFEYNSGTDHWNQLGSDIHGQGADDGFGAAVCLNDLGDTIAVGAWLDNTTNGEYSGSVRMFHYNRGSSSWQQLGQTLIGQASDDEFGVSLSLSRSGTIVGIGAHENDLGGSGAGQVSVYEYNSASFLWEPLGNPINGQVSGGYFGRSVSLDDSGLVVATGVWQWVVVYAYDRATSTWTQRGQTLLTQQEGDNYGNAVSLNGNLLAVGSDEHDVNGLLYAGQVGIFQYDATTEEWIQVGQRLNGAAQYDQFGYSVSLSANAVVAIGASGLAHVLTVLN